MSDLHSIARRYGLPINPDGRSLAVAYGRLVPVPDGVAFTSSGMPEPVVRLVCRLGTPIYRGLNGAVTVLLIERRIADLLSLFAEHQGGGA